MTANEIRTMEIENQQLRVSIHNTRKAIEELKSNGVTVTVQSPHDTVRGIVGSLGAEYSEREAAQSEQSAGSNAVVRGMVAGRM